jgi:hypothetical protein
MKKSNSILEKILLKIRYRNIVISISHSNYKVVTAGTEKVLCEEQEILFQNGISYIHFFPKLYSFNSPIDDNTQYLGMTIDAEFIDYFNINQLKAILYILKKLNIKFLGINIHHTLGIDMSILDKLISNISDNIKFFLHDYYSVCPQINFLKNDKKYCGNMPKSKCLDCVYGKKIEEHINKFRCFFHKYDITFVAPSQIAKELWVKTYGELSHKVRIVPHQVFKGTYRKNNISDDKIRLAYVGYQAIHKGWDMWKFITENIDTDKYELYHLGKCSEKIKNVNNIKVSFHKGGRDAMIKTIRNNNIDIVFLWSIWPETYSYTYFESYAAGAFVITNSCSGNIADQVIKNQNGIILANKHSIRRFLADSDSVVKLLKKNANMKFPLILDTNVELLDEIINLVCKKNEKFSFNKHDLINTLNKL